MFLLFKCVHVHFVRPFSKTKLSFFDTPGSGYGLRLLNVLTLLKIRDRTKYSIIQKSAEYKLILVLEYSIIFF